MTSRRYEPAASTTCRNRDHRPHWRVVVRNGNYSAFNGGRFTPSDYSEIVCTADNCHSRWRTKASYVATLPDLTNRS